MKRILSLIKFLIIILAASTLFGGCIIFEKVSYDVKLDSPTSGTVTITAYDLRSDAKTKKDFDKDKENLFEYALKSKKFITDQGSQGNQIITRRLFLKEGKLNGEVSYKFSDINSALSILFEDGFHYRNLELSDSVVSTNGEVIESKNYKRIMWDSSVKELQYTMFSFSFEKEKYKTLAPYFNQKKK